MLLSIVSTNSILKSLLVNFPVKWSNSGTSIVVPSDKDHPFCQVNVVLIR